MRVPGERERGNMDDRMPLRKRGENVRGGADEEKEEKVTKIHILNKQVGDRIPNLGRSFYSHPEGG